MQVLAISIGLPQQPLLTCVYSIPNLAISKTILLAFFILNAHRHILSSNREHRLDNAHNVCSNSSGDISSNNCS